MDKERYSRSNRDRDSTKDHHRDRERDGERRHRHHHHRDRDGDENRRDSDHHRSSSRREDRANSRDREGKREASYDRREDREDSRDRLREKESSKRERSREREDSYDDWEGKKEKELRSKRKEREEENVVREGEKKARVSEGKSERRRFEDSASKNEDNGVKEGSGAMNGANGVANVAPSYSASMASESLPESSLAPNEIPCTKVSSISTTNENRGVSIARSHEVPGKSSTDGTSSTAGKSSANLSLAALTKAKKALQMQKELAEKLKKIPLLNKGTKPTSEVRLTGVTGTLPSMTATDSASTLSAILAPAQPPASAPGLAGLGTIPNMEAVKRAQELAAKMGFRQDPEFAPLINLFPGQSPAEVAAPQKPTKAPVLRVDALGREVDEHGNVVNVTKPTNLSTLKVNINKQKKDAFQILKPQLDVDPDSNPYFDPRMGINKDKLLRPKRMNFQFVEEGKWTRDAENLKLKSQFGEAKAKELKVKQAHLAKVKADINPNLIEVSERVITKEKPKDQIPEVEWWDANILISGSYGDIADDGTIEDKLKLDRITHYVEHPRPIEPPAEPAPPPPQPLKLTKKEQKKLRTQRRLAREKEKQEMIRQGLLEPPKSKVKMSNLMKVLGSEATQDPTRLEKEIRTAAAEREQAHIDRNTARKLTPAERREKKERKLFDDPNTLETIVSVYKIKELSHPKARFKVEMNARENRLSGCAVITEGITVVVVEGKTKPIKRYGKLMLRRINWEEAVTEEEGNEEKEEEDKPPNKCVLVWQGSVAKPNFYRFNVQECLTDTAAKKVFVDAGVGHYWDLATNFSEE